MGSIVNLKCEKYEFGIQLVNRRIRIDFYALLVFYKKILLGYFDKKKKNLLSIDYYQENNHVLGLLRGYFILKARISGIFKAKKHVLTKHLFHLYIILFQKFKKKNFKEKNRVSQRLFI